MRRCLLFAVLFALVSLPGALAQEQGDELLKNPGFNDATPAGDLPAGWSTSAKQILWREKQYMGKDYEIASRADAYVLATQDVRLEPGKVYTLTMLCKAEGGGVAGALLMHGAERPRTEMPVLWNLAPTERYEEYVAVFTAPNPVARLYLYNLARKGTVYYDHVSLRQGEPDTPAITQISFRPIDRPLAPPPVTRHIPWAKPLAGGPVKTLITLRTLRCLRDAVELAQRLDLDYDVVDTGYEGRDLVSETGRRVRTRLKESEYGVYLISSRVNAALTKTVRAQVEAGAGLVVVEGFGQASKFLPADALQEAGADHFLRAGITWNLMPEDVLASVQTGALGKGRVVRLVFPSDKGRVWGLLPTALDGKAWRERQCEYWEWWQSLLAKAVVWAAGREGLSGLQMSDFRLQIGAQGAAVALRSTNAPAGARVRCILRSAREIRFDGPLLRAEAVEKPVGPDGTVAFPVPAMLPAGGIIADAMLLDGKGRVLAWGSFAGRTAPAAALTYLRADRSTYPAGGTVGLKVGHSANAVVDVVVEGRLIDALGRVLSQQRVSRGPAQGYTDVSLALPLRRPLTVHHKAFVRLLVDGKEQDSRWVAVLVPEVGPRQAAEEFVATTWAPGMSHPQMLSYYAERTRALGLNSEFATDPYAITEHGLLPGGYMSGPGFREERHAPDGIRPHCLSDPAVVAEYTGKAKENAAKQIPYGLYGAGITDEAFLASRHQRTEFCFCERCRARYRTWLQARYPSLDALNAQWGTSYRAWEEVRGARTEDVRGKANFAPFVDFRTFMTDQWVEACKTASDAYHEVAPTTPTGHTNTFGATPFDGNDYWKLATQTGFGWGQEYSEAIKASAHKAIFDLWRAFVETPEARASRTPKGAAPRPFFNYGWIGYDHRVEAARYEPWWLALHDARGVSYFATNALDTGRGTSWALVYPTLSHTPYAMAVKDALHDLRAGCGRIFLEYRREEPRIAILWSYPSMLVSWCESRWDEPEPPDADGSDSYGTSFKSAFHFRQHVNELQLDYTYLAPGQILGSDILKRYPVLFLPFTVAASPALVEKMEAYVRAGGVLVGDLRCLRTDDHGRPFAGSAPLRRLFGVERTDGKVEYGAGTVRFPATSDWPDLSDRVAHTFGRETLRVAEGKALAAHATGEPAAIVRQMGRGLSLYLNFALPAYDVATRELLRQVLARAGVERPVVVERAAAPAHRQSAPAGKSAAQAGKGPAAAGAGGQNAPAPAGVAAGAGRQNAPAAGAAAPAGGSAAAAGTAAHATPASQGAAAGAAGRNKPAGTPAGKSTAVDDGGRNAPAGKRAAAGTIAQTAPGSANTPVGKGAAEGTIAQIAPGSANGPVGKSAAADAGGQVAPAGRRPTATRSAGGHDAPAGNGAALAGRQGAPAGEHPAPGDTPPRCWERNTFTRGPIAVHAFIRDFRRCNDSDPARITFGKPAHLYDVRAGRYLGKAAETTATLAPGDTALYAALPYRVAGLTVTAPAQARPGAELAVRLALSSSAGTPGDHVLHLEFLGPSNRPVPSYTSNILATAGKATFTLPLALNDPAGRWHIRARDVLTGVRGEATFVVR